MSPNRQVSIFNDTILNIISNFIPHETIICDDRDPLWINSKIKKVIYEKDKGHKKYIHNKSNFLLLQNINNLQAQIKTLIEHFETIISPKSKKNWKAREKIPCIPPLYHDNKSVRDVKYLIIILRSSVRL